jgi:hydrogenase large subunit
VARTVIDPVTRIGGHLRIEADVEDGEVRDAWSSGTMFRGMELILKGRDPRDAWLLAQRICGLCGGVHALASVRAVEKALGITIPANARLIRNLMAGTRYVQDHVLHFYQLQSFDWIDLPSALDASPVATSTLARSISDWPQSSATYFGSVKERLAAFVRSGRPGTFANGYWGHPAYTLSPEANLLLAAHYLEALDWQRRILRIDTLLGGKSPHPQTYLVGGMSLAPPWGGPASTLPGEHPVLLDRDSPIALGARGLDDIAGLLAEAKAFVDQVYVPDTLLLAEHYRDWTRIGSGVGSYLAYGEFPEDGSSEPALFLPRGRIVGRDFVVAKPVDEAAIAETVAHSYYAYESGDDQLRRPGAGETSPHYAGPTPPVTTLEGSDKYSWLKAPRYDGEPMEVGPLARMLVAYAEGRGDVRVRLDVVAARLGGGREALFGTLGRIVARAAEAQAVVDRLDGWLRDLRANLAAGDLAVADVTMWNPASWPSEAEGSALGEGPRGAVGHWVRIKGRAVDAYQVVDATTWNGSPRDASGRRGALEEALVGTPVADPGRPVEILRTVHSFDPCTACAVHASGPGAGRPIDVRVSGGVAR